MTHYCCNQPKNSDGHGLSKNGPLLGISRGDDHHNDFVHNSKDSYGNHGMAYEWSFDHVGTSEQTQTLGFSERGSPFGLMFGELPCLSGAVEKLMWNPSEQKPK